MFFQSCFAAPSPSPSCSAGQTYTQSRLRFWGFQQVSARNRGAEGPRYSRSHGKAQCRSSAFSTVLTAVPRSGPVFPGTQALEQAGTHAASPSQCL